MVSTSSTGRLAEVVVAMDGPSGSGKSSTSRGVATRLGLRYLDTGAMFRAMTWWMLQQGIDVDDPEAVSARVDAPVLVSGTDPAAPTITVDGVDVSGPIRTQEVTSAVSAVSAVPAVRERLLREQRDIIGTGAPCLATEKTPSLGWSNTVRGGPPATGIGIGGPDIGAGPG